MNKTLRPLDPANFREPMRTAIRWHLLLTEADALSRAAGLGLASVWAHVHRNDYEAASVTLAEVIDDIRRIDPHAIKTMRELMHGLEEMA